MLVGSSIGALNVLWGWRIPLIENGAKGTRVGVPPLW